MRLHKTARIHSSTLLVVGILLILLSSIVIAAATFTVQETEEISLNVNATDPDNDDILFGFSSPFNENGKWKTSYDDAGEYAVDISATDGEFVDVSTVTVIVTNKNRAPIVADRHLTFKENDLIDLSRYIADPDDDILEYTFDDPFDNTGKWQTTVNDGGRYVIDFVVNDGKSSLSDRLEIFIEEINQAPTILDVFSESSRVIAYEGKTVELYVDAIDNDGNSFTYSWKLDSTEIATGSSLEYYFDYESEGEHTLILTLSDGELEVSQEWVFDVQKTNRRPSILDVDTSAYETETLFLEVPKFDIDGDTLTYSFEAPLSHDGEWKTTYDDAGTYTLKGTASDGEYETDFEIDIVIQELDRAPVIDIPEVIELSEGQTLEWFLDIVDSDGDDITVEVDNLPREAKFDEDDLNVEWDISYDYIMRKNNFIFNTLNVLRLEHYLLSKKERDVFITACGRELCSKQTTTLRVFNTNRAPEFKRVYDQHINESNNLQLYVNAIDPDGDIIKYSFSDPVGKRSGSWKTNYEDSGNYVVAITASDGFLVDNEQITVNVAKTNRDPTLNVKHDKVVVNEGQEFTITFSSSDPDNEDAVVVMMDSVPSKSSMDSTSFIWKPSYDTVQNSSDTFWSRMLSNSNYLTKKLSKDKAEVWLEFSASDGDAQVIHPLLVVVKNINRIPVIREVEPAYERFETVTDVPIRFAVDAYDLDAHELEYEWSFSGVDFNDVDGTNVITREFKSAGEKKVRVVVSDGYDKVTYEWIVDVKAGEKEFQQTVQVIEQPDFSFRIYKIENWK